MYGVPANLDLSFLHGAELVQICLGQFQLQFHFHPIGSISVEGGWELLHAAGQRIDGSCDVSDRPPYQLHRLLGLKVLSSEISAPDWFTLTFESGEMLRVFDDSEQFESFSIQPGNIFV
jgi:hypothetical protein